MIDLEELHRRLGTTPPNLFQWVIDVSPAWLSRARAAVPRPCPPGWPERLAEARWIGCDELEELFTTIGVWPGDRLVSHLACGLPATVGTEPGRRSDRGTAVNAFPASTVAFALLLMWRLGLPIPVDELLGPLRARLARETLLNNHEEHLRQWTSTRERCVSIFLWPGGEATPSREGAESWTCRRLYDGRAAFNFCSQFEFPTEVIGKPDAHRDLGLSLVLAGAPKALTSSLDLREIAQSAQPAGPTAGAEEPMAALRRLISEVRAIGPTQARRGRA